jgi:hypothetical protein
MYTQEQALKYLADYVFCGVTFLRETKDGYVFKGMDELEVTNVVKVFKSKKIRLDYYQVLKR